MESVRKRVYGKNHPATQSRELSACAPTYQGLVGRTRGDQPCKRRMQERGFDMTDIEHAIRYGRVTDHSKPHAWWRYVLDVRSVDGRPMRVVVEIDGRLIIVTVVRR